MQRCARKVVKTIARMQVGSSLIVGDYNRLVRKIVAEKSLSYLTFLTVRRRWARMNYRTVWR